MDIVVLPAGSIDGGGRHPVALLPGLSLLPHLVHANVRDIETLTSAQSSDVVLVDARDNPAAARATCRTLHATRLAGPTLAVVSQSGLAALSEDWGIDDLILTSAGPAEIEARLRLAVRRETGSTTDDANPIRVGELSIDPRTRGAQVNGRALDLTHREFDLLTFMARSPGTVFTREELMQRVWGRGDDYVGATRTIDVHVRRLRVKLGSDHESTIVTVRGVGYKFVAQQPVPIDDAEYASPAESDLRHGAIGDQASHRKRCSLGSRHGGHGPMFTTSPRLKSRDSRRR